MSEIDELLKEVAAWHVRVFGHPCNQKRTVIKLLEEASEVHASVRAGVHGTINNELVDVGLVLMSLLTATLEDGDFLEGIRHKMREVEQRDQKRRDAERGI